MVKKVHGNGNIICIFHTLLVYVVFESIDKSLLVFVDQIDVEVDCFDRGWSLKGAWDLVVLLGGVIVSKLCRELFADNGIWSIGGMGGGPTSL